MNRRRFAGLVFAATLSAARTRIASGDAAAPIKKREIDVLRAMPQDIRDAIAGSLPDASGMVGANKVGFKEAGRQRGPMLTLALAAAKGDADLAEKAWLAVDGTFAHLAPDGSFGEGEYAASSAAFWMAHFSHAMLVVGDSTLATRFAARQTALLPKIRKTADFLVTEKPRLLGRFDGHAANRLFIDAMAFGFSGKLLNDPKLIVISREFINQGLTKQRASDGVFVEKGGADSSYNAVSILKLQQYAGFFPDAKIDKAVRESVAWEIKRIKPDGDVDKTGNTRTGLGQEIYDGHPKDVNYPEVMECFLYYAARTGDKAAQDTAQRIYKHIMARAKNKENPPTAPK